MPEPVRDRLGLGAANLGNLHRAMRDEDAVALLDAAWDAGVRTFDTAPHYGLGLSEARLGAYLRDKPRAEFTLTTKVGRLLRPDPTWTGGLDEDNDFVVPADLRREWDVTATGLRCSLEESLQRLGLDRVDAVYLHDPERYDLARSLGEGLAGLAALRDGGLVAEVGVASMDSRALAAFARTGGVDRLMVASRYTLADQSAADEVLPLCAEHGVRVVVAAVFNSGLLATDHPGEGDLFDYRPVPGSLLRRVRRIAAVCRDHGVPLPVAALRFPLRHAGVDAVVVGAGDAAQVRANADAMDARVPPELWEQLRHERLVR